MISEGYEAAHAADLHKQEQVECRKMIRRGINDYAERTKLPYGIVWSNVYGAMTRRFDLDFSGSPVKLDAVQHGGLLGEMLAIVNGL